MSEPLFYKPSQNVNDADVWEEFKKGSQTAYAHIYQANVQALYDYGMHVHTDSDLVKDCIQELFVNIWQRRSNLGNVKNIRTYLIIGLRRQIIGSLNAGKKVSDLALEKLREAARFDLSHEHSLIADEISGQREHDLLHAIENLPTRQREIIYLVFYKNIPQEEIAEIMSINVASIYTLTWKAIKNLKKQLKYLITLLLPFLKLMHLL